MNVGSNSSEPVASKESFPKQGELFPEENGWRQRLSETFRTQLNAIIGFSELLGLEPLSANGRTDLKQVLKAARDLLDVVNQEFSGPQSPLTDDLANFTLVERILELRPGVSLKHATQGRLGIEMAKTQSPKLILLDLNLPDTHGADVLNVLHTSPETSKIPVVILSANAIPSQIERLLAAGARNYLTKPFDIDQFLAVVDEWTKPV
jgi:CheY-like chemotaxis protein